MALDTLEIPCESGKVIKATYCQFTLNNRQQFAVIDIDFEQYGGWENVMAENPHVEYTYLGKLTTLGVIMKSQLINSLHLQKWDFEKARNPEILLLSRKIGE